MLVLSFTLSVRMMPMKRNFACMHGIRPLQDLQLVQAACQSNLKLKCHGVMRELLSLMVHTHKNRLLGWTPHLMGSIRFMHVVHFLDYKMKANDLLKPEQLISQC
ncbi:TPA: hypothetical protein ACH3X3_006394 [Trebouxia sp. C0006]